MNVTTPVPTGRPTTDPLHLAPVTLKAVEEVGARAAAEIRETAESIRQDADAVAQNLEQLAAAITEHTREAGDHVSKFLARTKTVVETVRGLQQPPEGSVVEGERK
jgi:predicted transcriptional regulator